MLVVILGKSASGKDTLVKYLSHYFRYDKIVTFTSRPIREGETNKIDYNFVTSKEFKKMISDDKFVEYCSFVGWYYGTTKDSLKNTENSIVILNPSGFHSLKNLNIPFVSIYIDCPDKVRLCRSIRRGDDSTEVVRRKITDDNDFLGIEKQVDYIVNGEKNVRELATDVLKCVYDYELTR